MTQGLSLLYAFTVHRCGPMRTPLLLIPTSKDPINKYDLRQGIKEYSDWPTIPQLYVDG